MIGNKGQNLLPEEVKRPLTPEHRVLRERLISDGTIAFDGKKYVFTSDYVFKSPAEAASVVLGYESDGSEWADSSGNHPFGEPMKDDDDGGEELLHRLQEAAYLPSELLNELSATDHPQAALVRKANEVPIIIRLRDLPEAELEAYGTLEPMLSYLSMEDMLHINIAGVYPDGLSIVGNEFLARLGRALGNTSPDPDCPCQDA